MPGRAHVDDGRDVVDRAHHRGDADEDQGSQPEDLPPAGARLSRRLEALAGRHGGAGDGRVGGPARWGPTIANATMPPGQGFESPAQAGSGWGQTFWLMALLFAGISSLMGSINYITTIIKLRAPGMTMFRMPMTRLGAVHHLHPAGVRPAGAGLALVMHLLDKTHRHELLPAPAGLTFGNGPPAPAAASRCCTSTCSGSTRTRPSTS